MHNVIVTGGTHNVLEFWNAKTLELLHKIKLGEDIQSIDLSSDENTLAVATGRMHSRVDKSTFFSFGKLYLIYMRDLRVKEFESVPSDLRDGLLVVKYSPDGKYIAAGGGDRKVYIWDIASGRIVRRLGRHKHWITDIAFSPNGRYIAVADNSHQMKVYNFVTGNVIFQSKLVGRERCMEFAAEGNLMITISSMRGYSGQQLLLWDLTDFK